MKQLSEKEQAILESLVDPDAIANIKFNKWDDNFQRRLLGMLLTDSYFLVQSQSLILPEYFSNDAHMLTCKLLFSHFQKYKSLPEKFILLDAIGDQIREKDDTIKLYYRSEVNTVYDFYIPGMDSREVLLDKLTTFAKTQSMKIAFYECLEDIRKAPEEESTWGKVYDRLRQAMLIDRKFEVGLEYFPNIEEMFRRMKQQEDIAERFTSGFRFIDDALAGGGPKRGEIFSWIGLPGVGKSLALVKAAVENARQNKKVLYVSLEMDEVGIAQRFTSQFMRVPINHILAKKDEVVDLAKLHVKDLENPNLLIVKQFPSGSVDVNNIRAYINQLALHGFKPDLVIVDYIGEMKDTPGIPTWESRYRILRDLRGLAIEEDFCCFTCVQPNKSAAELSLSEYIDESNIGTSFDQFKPLDGFWSINQLTIEKDACVGRGFIIKHRNGKSRLPFPIEFDYNILNMEEMSWDRYRMRMSEAQSRVSDGVNIDQVKAPTKAKGKKNKFDPEGHNPIIDPLPGEV